MAYVSNISGGEETCGLVLSSIGRIFVVFGSLVVYSPVGGVRRRVVHDGGAAVGVHVRDVLQPLAAKAACEKNEETQNELLQLLPRLYTSICEIGNMNKIPRKRDN